MVNKVILVGRLGQDPEVRHLDNDRTVANFSMATNEVYRNKAGEKVENTDWHNIVIWGPRAVIAEKYLRKGSLIYLEGKLRTRSWEDKEGNKRYTTEVLGDNFQMMDRASDAPAGGGAPAQSNQQQNQSAPAESSTANAVAEPTDDDDLPF